MAEIPKRALRNHTDEVLRRVESGETLTVTEAGRPVAVLSRYGRRRWVSGARLAQVGQGPAPQTLAAEVAGLDAAIVDPYT